MAMYRFFWIVGETPMRSSEHEFADDLAALDEAQSLCQDHDIEIWRGALRIARVKRGNAPSTEDDPQSG